ncbi:hypothetical protein ABL78_3559 [Leptomonas seymouri]|uniref:Uncharacterized protein n=1 Tax=Leptomonas seymouri TaxID=5684 RepID=A0A0N1IL94_LEPSE|nr:hypothetical protein ABL78_3559 [Leptomonas seymouri]|eukprot:KPI87371.1 hypothetical protein ABL78_3559 [Leptomonas seymouri]
MEGDRAGNGNAAKKDATVPSELPEEMRRVAPSVSSDAPTSTSSTSAFASIRLRPEGQRYGDADLVPGGSLEGNGGMLMNERNFPRPGMGVQEDPHAMPGDGRGGLFGLPATGSANDYARFDPMFPGQMPPWGRGGRGGPIGGWRGGVVPAPHMPGEPDDDNFFPPGGRPGEPFGGPGGGQFGPCQGGFGSWGGRGGGSSPWA